jgi:zinc transport system ATP-binding protein
VKHGKVFALRYNKPMLSESNPILKISDLAISLDGETVIKDISFKLEEGGSLAIIGPNGAGKTVFLRALLGMIPYRGKIEWAQNVRIGYVPQKIDADRHLPVNFKNLLTAKADILRLPRAEVDEISKAVDLNPKIMEMPIGHLSGGQFQRALIALALLGNPNVLLLDEPTASIDASGEQQIYELVYRLQEERGMTAILVSHDLSFVYRYATKVLCINRAGLCFGPPEETLTPEILEKLYGGKMKYVHHAHGGQQ